MLKQLVVSISLALALPASACLGQTDTLLLNQSLVVSNFEVDASAPFFSKANLWIMFGGAPDQFTLYEYAPPDSGDNNFSLVLVDNGGTKWLELNSDIGLLSTVKLPDDTVKALGANGITFITALRQMFTDSTAHYVTGQVTLGDSLRYASAVELESTLPNVRRFLVRTYDDKDTYIEGEVLIGYTDCVAAYRHIDILVTQSKVTLKLTPVSAAKKN